MNISSLAASLFFSLLTPAFCVIAEPPANIDSAAPVAHVRSGDPYPLDTCPITGKKLGAMGDPDVKVYSGREIRFCCPACPAKFEKDLPASIAKVDEKIIADQSPLYPLKTSVVTGIDLPAKPYEFVFGNRLIRVGAESEKVEFLMNSVHFMAALDKAVVAQQSPGYPITKCPVSNEDFGGEMGKPVNDVVGGRLVMLCCKECKEDVEKNPAKYIAMVDAARAKGGTDSKPPKTSDHTDGHDNHDHGH